jgi:polygalacturonase
MLPPLVRRLLVAGALLPLSALALPPGSPFVANIVRYGAVGDAKTLCTHAINAALADIKAHGGGTLYIPPGRFLTSPFNFTSSGTVLLLDAATLIADTNFSSFPLVAPLPSYGQGRDHSPVVWERYGPFIGAYNLSQITITTNSSGIIHGQGAPWWAAHAAGTLCCTPPHLFEFAYGQGIEIGAPAGSPEQTLVIMHSPFWHLHLYSGSDAHVHDLAIVADPLSENTDGIDPDSFANTLIERFRYLGGDDAIAIKSGWDEAGIQYGVPTVNVTIRDLVATTRSACVCIGSEMSGGVANVYAENIVCSGTGTGYYVKSAPGRGGYVSNFTMVNATMNGVATAFEISVAYGDHPDGKPVNTSALPVLDGFTVSGVTGRGIQLVGSLVGMTGAAIGGVDIANVDLEGYAQGWTCSNVSGTSSNVFPPPCTQIGG